MELGKLTDSNLSDASVIISPREYANDLPTENLTIVPGLFSMNLTLRMSLMPPSIGKLI